MSGIKRDAREDYREAWRALSILQALYYDPRSNFRGERMLGEAIGYLAALIRAAEREREGGAG